MDDLTRLAGSDPAIALLLAVGGLALLLAPLLARVCEGRPRHRR